VRPLFFSHPVPLIDEMLENNPRFQPSTRPKPVVPADLDGLSVDDFQSALRAVEESSEVQDKRIIVCVLRKPGMILVQTGYIHGGCNGGGEWVLVVKNGDTWRVDGVRWWRS
jgi:hypothetical protein